MKGTLLAFSILSICLAFCGNSDNTPGKGEADKTKVTRGKSDNKDQENTRQFISYVAEPSNIRMFWKKDGQIIKSFDKLKEVEPQLVFAMNGGMFTEDYVPVGLYVEEGKQLRPMKKVNNPKVNFGIQPQGVFLVRNGKAEVVPLQKYRGKGVVYATQSAPMVVVDSVINPNIPQGNSQTVRNGVGILPNGKVLLACSKGFVTFKEFAQYFLSKGCSNALYLDGGVSRTTKGGGFRLSGSSFGVMIGVVE